MLAMHLLLGNPMILGRKPQILHLIDGHQILIHPTLQIRFTELATVVLVYAAGALDAGKVGGHERFAFVVVVEGEGAAFRSVIGEGVSGGGNCAASWKKGEGTSEGWRM